MKHTEFGHSITFIAQDWEEHPNFTHRNSSTIGDYDSDSNIEQTTRLHLDRNTWESWHLISDSRPTLPHPQQKTKIAESNSINGEIDLSWDQNPYPIFGPRSGSFTFIYNPLFISLYGECKPWLILYSEISEFLHGRKLRMVMEDDPGYYYEGRFWVENWTSNNDGTGSTITIGYSLDPYKISILSSLNEWIWDPFNFYNGVITSDSFKINVEGYDGLAQKESFTDLATSSNESSEWYGKTVEQGEIKTSGTRLNLFGLVGVKPIIPIIKWKPTYDNQNSNSTNQIRRKASLIVNYVNYAYGIRYGISGIRYKYFDPLGSYGVDHSLSSNGVSLIGAKDSNGFYHFKDSDMIFCDSWMGEYQYIQFIGSGEVQIEFHRGDL